jgi:uncharacterized membrane protein YozB (DUF420 family)
MTLATILPTVNAALNGLSACLLVAGYLRIRRGDRGGHTRCMLSALGVSTLFLCSYLVLRALAGMTRFTGEGWIRPIYFTLLLSHTVLAAVIVPLALIVLAFALRGRFDRHVRIARWTLPLWLYVSVTGVMIYVLLYHVSPGG